MSKSDQAGPYDILTRRGISPSRVDRLAQWSDRKLFDLLGDLRRAMPYTPSPADSPFNFVANDSLSGRAVPLATREQRLERVTQLARFAALYADMLLIRDPFEDYPRGSMARDLHGTIQQISRGLEPSDFSNARLRQKLIDDVRLVLFFRPLFSAGLLGFTTSSQHWCPSCVRSLVDRGQLHKVFSKPDEIAWQRRVAKITKHLEKIFLEKGRTLVHSHGDHSHAFMFVPQGVLEYDKLQ